MRDLKTQVLTRLKETDGFREFFSRHVKLIPSSTSWAKALCPFHPDKNPSLSVNIATGYHRCFGCDKHGDIFSFRMELEKLTFAECLKVFAQELQIQSEERKSVNLTVLPSMKTILDWHEQLFQDQNRAVREFLNIRRGITDESIKKFLLGCDERTKSIVIPIFDQSGQEVDTTKLIKYDLASGKKDIKTIGLAHLFNVHLLLQEYEQFSLVIVCEGELDAIVLSQNGYLAVSGSAGAGTWKEEWNAYFKDKIVIILYDSDDAGRRGAAKVMEQLLPIAASVKNVDLFQSESSADRKDATDFFVKSGKSAEDFRRIVESAEATQPLSPSGDSVIIRALQEEGLVRRVNPAQDYVDGTFFYTVRVKNKPYLLTSERECIAFDDCERRRIYRTANHVDDCKFSAQGILSFLQRERSIHSFNLFSDIRVYVKRYIVLKNPDAYDYLALWVLGTYVFECFRYYPYLHLQGEKRSGKTLLLQVLAPICFNGQVSLNPTEAVIFRDVHNNAPTLLLDEVELFKKQDTERFGAIMSVLKAGFAKGAIVKRCGGQNKDRIESFNAYSPKALAGINVIDDVLQDRTVGIRMLRKLDDESVQRYLENSQTVQFQNQTRDDLYLFGLSFGPQIAETYRERLSDVAGLEHLNNREFDIWAPIIVLANLVDDDGGLSGSPVTDTIVKFSKLKAAERVQDDSTENETVLLLAVINDLVKIIGAVAMRGKLMLFNKDVVFDHFKGRDEFSWVETKSLLTRMLKKIEVVTKNFTIEGHTHSFYVVDPDVLADYTRRYVPKSSEM